MTQAELAGGTIDARQASPAKGQLIRDFTLTSTLGQEISLSDYRGSFLIWCSYSREGAVDNPDLKVLAEIAELITDSRTSRPRCWPLCNVPGKRLPE